MPKDPSPKKRFTVLLVTIYLISVPVISGTTYLILKEDAIKTAHDVGRLHLATIEAVKHYISEDLRPVLYKELPGRFIIEGMSRAFAAGSVVRRVQKEISSYEYKNASLNPLNPGNLADDFERATITAFIRKGDLKEWNGFRTKPGGEYYVIARAGQRVDSDCLRCHGDPSIAPKELTQRYGTRTGFNMKRGELVDATFVYIPISAPLAVARKNVLIFIGVYSLFGLFVLAIVISRSSRLYNRIDAARKRVEEINRELISLNHDMESIVSERAMNLIALNVADRVRNPATTIAGTFNRILKNEPLSESLKIRISEMVAEAEKLETIVKDYETILRKKRILFSREDLNGIVENVLPLIESERKEKGVSLLLNLSSLPLPCLVNKQLLRVAVLHLLRNAIEAAPSNGSVSVSAVQDKDLVKLSITDTGKGFSQEEADRLLSLFYSSKDSRLDMGLLLARQIVEEHKGELVAESRPGEGSTFTIILPTQGTGQV